MGHLCGPGVCRRSLRNVVIHAPSSPRTKTAPLSSLQLPAQQVPTGFLCGWKGKQLLQMRAIFPPPKTLHEPDGGPASGVVHLAPGTVQLQGPPRLPENPNLRPAANTPSSLIRPGCLCPPCFCNPQIHCQECHMLLPICPANTHLCRSTAQMLHAL